MDRELINISSTQVVVDGESSGEVTVISGVSLPPLH